jgi:hypothetical protein
MISVYSSLMISEEDDSLSEEVLGVSLQGLIIKRTLL